MSNFNRAKREIKINHRSMIMRRRSLCLGGAPIFLFFLLIVLIADQSGLMTVVEGKACRPSGKIRGKKPPPGECKRGYDSECCKEGKLYTTYKCSPPVTSETNATLTINSFERDGDGGGPSACDGEYHPDDTLVVALSSGWFRANKRKRCLNKITISANGRRVDAMVVDECDSTTGCDNEHDYQPPCDNNVVDASKAVWKALGVPSHQWGELEVTWTDA